MSKVVQPRGMRDLLPADMERRLEVLARIRAAYRSFGYRPIEAPAMESLEYLCSGDGGDNEKLMYKVLKRGLAPEVVAEAKSEDSLVDLGLRYDLTVPLARYHATNSAKLPAPFRALHIGPVWRAERPQRGRYRQFVQCDIDIIGEPSIIAEVELVQATAAALTAVGVTAGRVRINDRRVLMDLMASSGVDSGALPALLIQVDKVDKIGIDGVREQIESRWGADAAGRVADTLRAMADPTTRMAEVRQRLTSDDGRAGLADVASIDELLARAGGLGGFVIEFDPTLVRGMGYYTGPIFEIEHADFPGTIAAGGRYDRMIGKISGKDTPACGFSIGFERIMDLLGDTIPAPSAPTALFHDGEVDHGHALERAQRLRETGADVVLVRRVKNRRAQFERLAAEGITEHIELDPA